MIIPLVQKIEHNHCYFSHKDLEKIDIAAQAPSSQFSFPMNVSESNAVTKEDVLDSLFVNEEERIILEEKKQEAKAIVLIVMKPDVLGLQNQSVVMC